MPTFEYQAESADGQIVSGREFGTSLDKVASVLAKRGLTVRQLGVATSVADPLANVGAPVPIPPGAIETPAPVGVIPEAAPEDPLLQQRSYVETSVWGPLVDRVPLVALAFFFRQGATMLEAGVPIVQTMATLARQTRDTKLQRIISELGDHVEAGRPLSFGMQRYPEVFSAIMVSLTRAGEKGGFLDAALAQVADYLDREIELRNLYKRITFYPKLQIGASVLIILGANFIIASVAPGGQGLSSPLTTPATWIALGPLIIAIFLFIRVGLANGGIKYGWDWVIAKLPGVSKIMHEFSMAKFGRAFGALHKAGIPLTESMKLSADACGNEYIRSLMYPAVKNLESGEGITEIFRASGAFSPLVIDMVQTGEMTGSLDKMLEKVADFYEDEAATKSTQLAQITGVILGLLVAIYIGYIIITFYMGYSSGIMKNA